MVLGTPLSLSQQSSGLFRALAPSPRVQETTHPVMPVSDPATTRNEANRVDHAYLADKYHKGGRQSQDGPSKAEARAKRAAIQRDHRSRRRAGEAVSLTRTVSQLSISRGAEPAGEDASQDRPRAGTPQGRGTNTKKEVTGASSRNLILTLRIMLTYCFRPLDHAGTSSNWGLRQTPNRRTMETVFVRVTGDGTRTIHLVPEWNAIKEREANGDRENAIEFIKKDPPASMSTGCQVFYMLYK